MTNRKLMIATAATLCTLIGTTMPAFAQPLEREREPNPHMEWRIHPNLTHAVHEMEMALHSLQAAGDDYGGNKAAAIGDLQRGIHSLRKAILFRTHLDDNAIDHFEG